jgi:hypothetical protein
LSGNNEEEHLLFQIQRLQHVFLASYDLFSFSHSKEAAAAVFCISAAFLP